MIHKTFANGKIEILVTDAEFGHVVPGDKNFHHRLLNRDLASYPTVWMDQQHTALVAHADKEGILPATDGVYSRTTDLMLVTKTADCVPILLWNEKSSIIGALHCGWKGFTAGVIDSFKFVGVNYEDCDMSDFSAFLGPHLRAEHFEVQQDFIGQLSEKKQPYLIQRDGKTFFDITRGVTDELNNIGISKIEDCGIDTYRNPEYFSYRTWTQSTENDRKESYSTFANCIVMKREEIKN
ncbi:MAG: polyphenol oxidase family protein [Candidatus Gracilibacteria bacterium]|nr:polyphenol oxidase family protein [Candidatus Gracilibacteria bacterium]